MSVYITNVLGCRPPENREPRKEERETCAQRLEEIAMKVQPKAVLLLGKVARMGWKVVGDWEVVEGMHPAAILRKGGPWSTEYVHLLRLVQDLVGRIGRCTSTSGSWLES